MSVVSRLTDIYLKFNRRVLFDAKSQKKHRNMQDQRKYLEHFKTPKDEFEKAYFKYKCHAYYHYSVPVRLLYNSAGIVMVPFFIVSLVLKKIKLEDSNHKPDGAIIVVSPTMEYKDILPKQIKEQYSTLREVEPIKITERNMDKEAWKTFRKCLMKYWMHPYFCLEVLIRLAWNCKMIQRYNPEAIIGYGWERDFAAPILLQYCNLKGVKRLTFMHGIFVYSIDKAFLSFNKYYVWEEYYVKMFRDLKADYNCLEIYKPQKYEAIVKPRSDGKYEYFLTYYFTAESENRMVRIKKCLDLFSARGLACKLRPHPRFTDVKLLEKIFEGYLIEDSSWTLEDSMECSEYIAAYNSTVLAEAYYSDKKVVIDDYVDPAKFQNMIDRDYIMLSRPHKLMTELIKEECKEIL